MNAYTDLSLVFWNALFYNEPGSQIALDAETLKVSHRSRLCVIRGPPRMSISPCTFLYPFPSPFYPSFRSPPHMARSDNHRFRFRRPCWRLNGRSVPCFRHHATHHPLPRLKRFTEPFQLLRRSLLPPNPSILLPNPAQRQKCPSQPRPQTHTRPKNPRHNAPHRPRTPPPPK